MNLIVRINKYKLNLYSVLYLRKMQGELLTARYIEDMEQGSLPVREYWKLGGGGAYCTHEIQPNDGWLNIEFDTRRGRRRQQFRRMKEVKKEAESSFGFNISENY
jgi:hypothetical protein